MASSSNKKEPLSGAGGRKFYEIPASNLKTAPAQKNSEQKLLPYIRASIIGKDVTFKGPFGQRLAVYCDFTASGRSLTFLEDYIRDNVLSHYANTHTTTCVTSLQTTMYRQEARDIVRHCVNAGEGDAVIFAGHGCTGAVHKLIHGLNLQAPPIVFVGPYEHHSNLLPWRNLGAQVKWIKEQKNGGIDLEHLENELQQSMVRSPTNLVIGCFTAASNITGILVDVDAVAACLHKYNALAFFDYATAGPYEEINMNPAPTSEYGSLAYKDAVILSPHKFVGGPGTTGVLVVKKRLFINNVPCVAGGGSVFYVTETSHRYLKELEMREEGGTPAIVECIRTGLVFQLKEAVSVQVIKKQDEMLTRLAMLKWSSCTNLVLLGDASAAKLPIFSFVVRHCESGRLLHHNYVGTLLNDVFGIQSRSGCACAGPYAQKLLGISEEVALKFEDLLLEDQRLDRYHLRRYREYSDKEVFRPGFTRLNFPYFYDDEMADFIVKAVAMVANHGWKLLPFYKFNPETGEWWHRNHKIFADRKWLGAVSYDTGEMTYPKNAEKAVAPSMAEVLKQADMLFSCPPKCSSDADFLENRTLFDEETEKLRWFLLPSEAQGYLRAAPPSSCASFVMPFTPGAPVETCGDSTEQRANFHYCSSCSRKRSDRHLSFANGTTDEQLRREISPDTSSYGSRLPRVDKNPSQPFSRMHVDPGLPGTSIAPCSSSTPSTCAQDDSDQVLQGCSQGQTGVAQPGAPISEVLSSFSRTGSVSAACPRVPACANDVVCLSSPSSPPAVQRSGVRGAVRFHNPPKLIFAPAVQAIDDFGMIKPNDRVLLCLSGGKDSLTMLHVIKQYQHYASGKGVHFNFGAMTVDPQSRAYDPRPLVSYLAGLGVPYYYEEQNIIQQASDLQECESICSFCSRMKRGRIYACARREGYNVIALGQHLDDLAESFLMSTFHNGLLRTMKAHYTIRDENLRVIRPLVYVREKHIRNFAEKRLLPVIPENCPACFEAPKERHRMKQLLAQQELLFPNLFDSLLAAMKPLLAVEDARHGTRDFNQASLQRLLMRSKEL